MDNFDLRTWNGFTRAGGAASMPALIDQVSVDSRRIHTNNALFVALEGKTLDGHTFIHDAIQSGARFIIGKKGKFPPPSQGIVYLQVEDPLRSLQEIAAAYRSQMPCRIVAIAGSFGKTMVKDLLQKMLDPTFSTAASPESFNSQLGVPLSLFTIKSSHEIALIEAGISQKNEMEALAAMIQPDAAIITHIGKKHLSTLGSIEIAAEEILKITSHPTHKSWALLPDVPSIAPPAQCENIYRWPERSPNLPHARFTSAQRGSSLPYRVDFPDGTFHAGKITSGFYYFLDLITITTKAAWLLGASSSAISQALKNYIPEPMRTEIWKAPQGATFINEPYCSDPQSIDKALAFMHQTAGNHRKLFVFGGMRGESQHRETDYRRIGKAVCAHSIDHLLLYGNHPFSSLIDEVSHLSPEAQISVHASCQEALNHLRDTVRQDDVVMIKGEHKQPIDDITRTFNDSICSNQCIINLAAIAENIQTIRSKLPPKTRLMVMVKALAYGTDDVRIAKFLQTCGVDILGVSYVDEGVALRRAGVSQAIFVINAAAYEAAKVVKWDLEVGLSDKSVADAVAREALHGGKKTKVHLHIDTGMSRFGCRPEEVVDLALHIKRHPQLTIEGVMTHFACADDPSQDTFTMEQIKTFDQALAALAAHQISPSWRHAANSSGAIRFSLPQYNMVRVGLAAYGLHSSPAVRDALDLRLALSLISRVVGINVCKEGETISYGRSYKIDNGTQRIGVLPIGYFDGLHRNYSGKGAVMVRGRLAPMVGKICMDFMMINLTSIPHASVGDPVLIFGEDEYGNYLSPEALAASGDSIIHELITCLGPRIHRIFVHEEAHRRRHPQHEPN